jgi:nicotinamide-nucleotide amidase
MTDNFEPDVTALAKVLGARQWRMASAESCTGGLIAAACTSVAGSSTWFERGFVTYSNEAKTEMLGVDPALIAEHGAVSEAVARAMVQGALQRAPVQLAVAVTGIAGPGGATPGKPVGTVWLAWGTAQQQRAHLLQLLGTRTQIRQATVAAALKVVMGAALTPELVAAMARRAARKEAQGRATPAGAGAPTAGRARDSDA